MTLVHSGAFHPKRKLTKLIDDSEMIRDTIVQSDISQEVHDRIKETVRER